MYIGTYIQQSVLEKRKPKKLNDNELISLYLSTQSNEYFSILYQRYIGKIYSKCISLLKDEVLAEDAAQEIYLKIFLNLARFNKKSRFSTWVYSITYNYCIDLIRRNKKTRKLFSSEEDKDYGDVIEEVDDKEILEMEIHRLQEVLEVLPVDDKAVLLMKYKEELSIKEISAIINKSESAVKMKIKRAKHKSRKIYQARYQHLAY